MGIYCCCLRANGLANVPPIFALPSVLLPLEVGKAHTHAPRPASAAMVPANIFFEDSPCPNLSWFDAKDFTPTCVTMAPTGLMVCHVAQGACKSCASLSGPQAFAMPQKAGRCKLS